jgi:uncharacterized protein (AIM24 family)
MFLRLHAKNQPMLVNINMISLITKKLKGVGSVVVDASGEMVEVDETVDDISVMVGEMEVEILESAND